MSSKAEYQHSILTLWGSTRASKTKTTFILLRLKNASQVFISANYKNSGGNIKFHILQLIKCKNSIFLKQIVKGDAN